MQISKKTFGNRYYQARMRAAKSDDRLSSRDAAAEYMSIDRSRLARIENGLLSPADDEAAAMTAVYGDKELPYYYCRHDCQIGRSIYPDTQAENGSGIAVNMYLVQNTITQTLNPLMSAIADGTISDKERRTLSDLPGMADELIKLGNQLKMFCSEQKIGGTGHDDR